MLSLISWHHKLKSKHGQISFRKPSNYINKPFSYTSKIDQTGEQQYEEGEGQYEEYDGEEQDYGDEGAEEDDGGNLNVEDLNQQADWTEEEYQQELKVLQQTQGVTQQDIENFKQQSLLKRSLDVVKNKAIAM